ncbi:MAG: 4'-phosphopantetheinyl transferase superfamily protein [Humibacillus sp.]|nr:4'-phosphopantetheinyl transferase superfamily protein [Humibacillus sp.]MDN5775528.1 4'-phosphopantetheinyl transferase superfamily protein [Humibacillus sp.]
MSRVDAWIAQVPDHVARSAERGRLDATEKARFDEIAHAPTARAYLALHTLARQVVGSIIGAPSHAVRFDRTCPVCRRQHGRPTVGDHPELHVSLSRTTTLVALAVTSVGPVGIDVEEVGATAFAGFGEVALHPVERASAHLPPEGQNRANATAWVRKEAALKAIGTGLRTDPATVLTPPTGIPTVIVPGTGPVTVTDLVLHGRAARTHVAALAVEGDPTQVVVHTEEPSP